MRSATILFERNLTFRKVILDYLSKLFVQAAGISAARAAFDLPTRLARLIRMLHQRTDGDTIDITHYDIARLLCTGRPGVTEALHHLEGIGAIRATRGSIRIRDQLLLSQAGDLNSPDRLRNGRGLRRL
ncbi:Crp/Fnr family transcriptional regulator [Sphingomonas sp. S2-65]|uniref:Crp/Fnr family transcriptional regulator n=1 Tax=Sphingomonas sp. S2-65 TaxID=2903960 RepID=UPI0039B6EADD